ATATPTATPVCQPFLGGLTIGYWKTHTGLRSSPRDRTYNRLPIFLGIQPNDGEPETTVNTEADAFAVFDAAKSTQLAVLMLKAQLLAAKLNALKFSGFADAYFPDGQQVSEVIAQADKILDDLANDASHTKSEIAVVKDLLDAANNNGEGQLILRTCSQPPPHIQHTQGDYDGDGFSDEAEGWYIGTSAARACGANAWPPDINNDGSVDVIGDISVVAGEFANTVPPAPARYDIAPDPPDAVIDVIG